MAKDTNNRRVGFLRSSLIGAGRPRENGGLISRILTTHDERQASASQQDWQQYTDQCRLDIMATDQRIKLYMFEAEQNAARLRWEVATKNEQELQRYNRQRDERRDRDRLDLDKFEATTSRMKVELERDKWLAEEARRRATQAQEQRTSQEQRGGRMPRLEEIQRNGSTGKHRAG